MKKKTELDVTGLMMGAQLFNVICNLLEKAGMKKLPVRKPMLAHWVGRYMEVKIKFKG